MSSYIFAKGVILAPITDLSDEQQSKVDAKITDYIITKSHSRERSRIIGEDAAILLNHFNSPIKIGEAIIKFAKQTQISPETVLSKSFALLSELVKIGWLIDVDTSASEPTEPSFSIGSDVLGFKIERVVQLLEDTEVYQAIKEGNIVAIKLLRFNAPSTTKLAFGREQEILEQLPSGILAPKILYKGLFENFNITIMSWCDGEVAPIVFGRVKRKEQTQRIVEQHKLLCAIADAYSSLHLSGFVHGDIHPRNILISNKYEVSIIDYGFAEGHFLKTYAASRNTIAFFEEPEFALSKIKGVKRPIANPLGEQYCVAAMLYFLLVGKHYIDFSYDKKIQSQQIINNDPLPFSMYGCMPWPDLEKVLSKALSKDVIQRYQSMEDFANALHEVSVPDIASAMQHPRKINNFFGNLPIFSSLYKSSPHQFPLKDITASTTYGASGIALALLRASELTEDAVLLSLADSWSLRAIEEVKHPAGLHSSKFGIDSNTVGRTSLHHGMSGIYFVRALVSNSQGDQVSREEAIDKFVMYSVNDEIPIDVTLGKAGALIGACILYCACKKEEKIKSCGEKLAQYIMTSMKEVSIYDSKTKIPFTGIAHGWAGMIFSLLLWYKATNSKIPQIILDRLEELRETAIQSSYSIKWPRKYDISGGSNKNNYLASWCNGSAGQVLLWSYASKIIGSSDYMEIAIRSASHVMESSEPISDLCCGLAGKALCLSSLSRLSGDLKWHGQAEKLIDIASESSTYGDFSPLSLMKGSLGLELAILEINFSERSRFPLIESEWI